MNCHSIQNRILSLTDPRRLPESLRSHLDGCPACTAWYARAVRLERLIETLPAPPATDKKTAFLDELTSDGLIIKSVPKVAAHQPPRFRAKHIAALAAAVLVMIGGWWVVTRPNKNDKMQDTAALRHPLLDKIVQRDTALAKAKTPAERLEVLGGLADDLQKETHNLARVANTDELRDLARWFDKVVKNGIVKQAGKIPQHAMTPDERAALYNSLSNKLLEASAEAERVSREVPPESQPALRKMAETAREGQKMLRERELIRGEGP